jgi:hypothetical protein
MLLPLLTNQVSVKIDAVGLGELSALDADLERRQVRAGEERVEV